MKQTSYKIFLASGLFLVELNTIFTHAIDYITKLLYGVYGYEMFALPLPFLCSGLMDAGT
jgi:hypothetical protein